MNLIDEIKKCVPISDVKIILSSSGGYVGGVTKIELITREKIVFVCPRGKVTISGSDLEFTKLTAGDAGFKGNLTGVTFE